VVDADSHDLDQSGAFEVAEPTRPSFDATDEFFAPAESSPVM
jgi:hypothetical protein